MILSAIKTELGTTNLRFTASVDVEGKPLVDKDGKVLDWHECWLEGGDKVRLSAHGETLSELKANPAMANLALQPAGDKAENGSVSNIRIGKNGPYTCWRLIKFTERESTFNF